MAQFKVTAPDTEGREYVYTVVADNPTQAACYVYAEHGQAFKEGRVPAKLTPWFESVEV